MLLASVQNVTKRYGAQTVLDGVSFHVNSGQKLGLIGPNGGGKTTVLRIMLGLEHPSGGDTILARGISVGYVPQHVDYDDDETVTDRLLADHTLLTARLREQEENLARVSGPQLDKAMRAYQRVRDEYDRLAGDRFPDRAGAMLDALGLAGRGEQKIGSLSGGEKNVLALTQALLAEPDLLVLDEPANHLDYLGIAWLEAFLSKFKGALLIVSHNRYLLDRVVGGILHLEGGRVTYYDGGYSAYRATRLRRLLAQQSDYVANQKRLAQLEALVRRFADIARGNTDPAWGKRLRARRSQLAREKAQAVEKPVLDESSIRANFASDATRANIALQIRGYSKAFGDLKLLEDADLDVSGGECVALVGPNGCGKTSLLRDIVSLGAWEHPTIRVGPSFRVGYCAQEQEVLQGDRTILDEILAAAPPTTVGPALKRKHATGILARFLFSWDDQQKRVADLSGGERNRLQLARLMVLNANFLILDEPTNHLDIPAREAVEEALSDFAGTILVVSHDRYLLDKIADRVVEVRDRKLVSYPGNFTAFWYARQGTVQQTDGRVTGRRRQRQRTAPPRRAGKGLSELEKRISDAEQQKVELERRMADAFSRRDHREGARAAKQLSRLQARLDDLYERWVKGGEQP